MTEQRQTRQRRQLPASLEHHEHHHHMHRDLSDRYERTAELGPEVRLYWTVHAEAEVHSHAANDRDGTIDLAVAYRLPRPRFYDEDDDEDDNNEDRGRYWVGFGLTEQGGMVGADMFLYLPRPKRAEGAKAEGVTEATAKEKAEAAKEIEAKGILLDAHGVAYAYPMIDSCGQDWTLLNYSSTCTAGADRQYVLVVVEVTRALSSNDVNEDLPFLDDGDDDDDDRGSSGSGSGKQPTRVVAAWGRVDWPSAGGDREEADGRRRHGLRRMANNNTAGIGSSSADADAAADANVDDASADWDWNVETLDLPSILAPHGPAGRVSGSVRFFGAGKNPNSVGSAAADATDDDGGGDGDGGDDDDDDDDDGDDDDDDDDDDSSAPNTGTGSSSTASMNGDEHESSASLYIDLVPSKAFAVPGEVTTYQNHCFTVQDYPELADLLAVHGQVHITGFRDLVGGIGNDASASASSAGRLVHHMDLHGTRSDVLGRDKRLCRTYLDLVHPWEAGSPTTFRLPPEAGIPLGGAGGYRAFRVEVHYHNPGRRSGLVDRSGVRVYYTVRKRPLVAGLMLLGDYELKLRGTYTVGSVRKNSTEGVVGMRHSFYCPPSCFAGGLNSNASSRGGVTVFREVLHMHQTGLRMTNIHLSGDGSPQRVSEANRFDFSQGAGFSARANLPYRIEPNDSFITTCYFSQRGTFWGSGSSQEMCQAFLWYYPKREDLSLSCGYTDIAARKSSGGDALDSLRPVGCEMSYDRSEVMAETDYDRVVADDQCQAAVASARPMDKYPVLDLDFRSWPSLVALLRSWRKSTKRSGNNEVNATLAPKKKYKGEKKSGDCALCWDGSRPTEPDVVIQGFSWTCDELDAALPILFTRPELLFLTAKDVAQCQEYQKSFGEMCGCPALPNDGKNSHWKLGPLGNRNGSENSAPSAVLIIGFLLIVAAVVASIQKRR